MPVPLQTYVQTSGAMSTDSSVFTKIDGLLLQLPASSFPTTAIVTVNLPAPYAEGNDFPGAQLGISINDAMSPVIACFSYPQVAGNGSARVPTTLVVGMTLGPAPLTVQAWWLALRGSQVFNPGPATMSAVYIPATTQPPVYAQSSGTQLTTSSKFTSIQGLAIALPSTSADIEAIITVNLPNPYATGTNYPGAMIGISVNGAISPVQASFTSAMQKPWSPPRSPTTLVVGVPLTNSIQQIQAVWFSQRGSTVTIDTPASISAVFI